jgi:protein-S-isoprenylcysteine O-methyltransferase Ste14
MDKRKDYIFVAIQLLLIALWFWFWWPFQGPFVSNTLIRVIGLVMAALGVILVVWPAWQIRRAITMLPTPTDQAQLITTGAFRWIRHPIYSGIVSGACGLAIAYANWGMFVCGICLLILFYFKSMYEESRLRERFPTYISYQQKTGRFFPGL